MGGHTNCLRTAVQQHILLEADEGAGQLPSIIRRQKTAHGSQGDTIIPAHDGRQTAMCQSAAPPARISFPLAVKLINPVSPAEHLSQGGHLQTTRRSPQGNRGASTICRPRQRSAPSNLDWVGLGHCQPPRRPLR